MNAKSIYLTFYQSLMSFMTYISQWLKEIRHKRKGKLFTETQLSLKIFYACLNKNIHFIFICASLKKDPIFYINNNLFLIIQRRESNLRYGSRWITDVLWVWFTFVTIHGSLKLINNFRRRKVFGRVISCFWCDLLRLW